MEPDPPSLHPVSREDLVSALAYALRFNASGKPHRLASDPMAQLAAQVLVDHLERAGFVVMRRPTVKPHATP